MTEANAEPAAPTEQSQDRVRAEDLPTSRRIAAFAFVLVGYVFYSYAWGVTDLLRPYIREASGLTLAEVGWLYSFQSAGALVGALTVGQLADRLGRRNMLGVITFGYGAALLTGVVADSFIALAAHRAVLGVFLGGVFSVAVGLYVGLFDAHVRGRLASLVGATFGLGSVVLGWAASILLDTDWTLLLWFGAIPPMLLAALTFVIIPDDRRIIPFGGEPPRPAKTASRMPVGELFSRDYRRTTLLLTLLSGLSLFGYQTFSAWITTFLKDVRGFSGQELGVVVAWQGVGGILGGFFWGWIADRFGRKAGIIGFLLGSGIIILYLQTPGTVILIASISFIYSFAMSSAVAWGPFFAELYPPHLRSTAVSIAHWGRIIGFIAPAVTVMLAGAIGLPGAMMCGAIFYITAAAIWWSLPETLDRKSAKTRAST